MILDLSIVTRNDVVVIQLVGYQVRSFYYSFVRPTVDNIVSLSRIEADSCLAGLYGTIIDVIDTGAMI